jgi:hypothetical protein
LVVAALGPADANYLEHLAPETDRRTVEGLLVRVDTWSLPDQIGLMRLDKLSALEQLPAEECDECCGMVSVLFDSETPRDWRLTKDEHGVVNEEVLHTPWPE